MKIRLAETRFDELDKPLKKPDKCFYSQGARRFSYYETRWFGNPGHYQTYFVALNDAGYYDDYWKFPYPVQGDNLSADQPEVAAFRSDARINTYGVTAPHFSVDDLKQVWIGPDHDQVRILGS